jgi:TetR/AcrR family transcriptional regulator, lmrAB and yxaGH operons repressor
MMTVIVGFSHPTRTRVIIKREMPTDARQRMIVSATVLMRERGVEATSFSEVLAHSGAPRGSIYHHFPGGKAQLIEAATRYAGEFLARGIAKALSSDDPVQAVRAFADSWQAVLEDSDFAAGCPVVAATLEGDRSPAARDAAGEAFASWEAMLAGGLEPHIGDPERAGSIATLAIAAIEGGVVLARAERSTVPLERVANELELLIRSAIERGGAR